MVELMQFGWLELSVRKQLPAGGIRSADIYRFDNDGEGDISFPNVGREVLISFKTCLGMVTEAPGAITSFLRSCIVKYCYFCNFVNYLLAGQSVF